MARVAVPMPQMGESIAEGTVSVWLKKVGDAVERDEPIMEISTDKVDAEIPSPVAGVLAQVVVEEGTTVEVGTVVAYVETDASAGVSAPDQPTVPEAAVGQPETPAPAGNTPEEEPATSIRGEAVPETRRDDAADPPRRMEARRIWRSGSGHGPRRSCGASRRRTGSTSRRSTGRAGWAG